MIKNITVTDEQGNEYEATWPRRAKGLVKSGRARFVNEYTICLAHPPDHTEGNIMEYEEMSRQSAEEASAQSAPDGAANAGQAEAKTAAKPELGYVISQIDRISMDSAYLHDCISTLEDAEGETANAIRDIVQAREHTNQCMLNLLHDMVHALKPQPVDPDTQKLNTLRELLSESGLEENHKFDILNQAVQKLF